MSAVAVLTVVQHASFVLACRFACCETVRTAMSCCLRRRWTCQVSAAARSAASTMRPSTGGHLFAMMTRVAAQLRSVVYRQPEPWQRGSLGDGISACPVRPSLQARGNKEMVDPALST